MLCKAIHAFRFQLRQSLTQLQVPLLLLLAGIYAFTIVQPVSDFSAAVGVTVSPWVFPHLANDYVCQIVFMSIAVILFCDAPFRSPAYWYVLPRTGNAAWARGMCLYIAVLSLLYLLLIALAGVLALLPNLQIDNGWGKIWGTLARTTAASQYHIQLTVNDYLIGAYQPMEATILSFLLEWACCTWLGLLSYGLNNLTHSNAGSFVAEGFVLLDIAVYNNWSYQYFLISPSTLAQLSLLTSKRSLYGVDLHYSACFFAISIFALTCLCILAQCIKMPRLRRRREPDE